jgi:hypothetical protein
MEGFELNEALSPILARVSLEQFALRYPEAAYTLVEYLSEEVQAADGQLRMVWEEIPAGFPIGRA